MILGLVCAVGGLIAAEAASLRLLRLLHAHRDASRRTLIVPLGAAVFVALPVVWDFATSGLESGLAFGWLGLSYWLLVRSVATTPRRAPLTGFVLGLGVLVRPDLAVFSIGFFAALLLIDVVNRAAGGAGRLRWRPSPRQLCRSPIRSSAWATSPRSCPTPRSPRRRASRSGRRGSCICATSSGRTSSGSRCCRCSLVGRAAGATATPARHGRAAVLAAPVVSALMHAAYVVRIGGDFMHGRFFLPTLFALLLPLMLVELPLPRAALWRSWLAPAAVAVVLSWALFAPGMRVAYWERISADGLADERSVYSDNAGRPNPITLDDYLNMRQTWPRDGRAWRARADAGARVLIVDTAEYPLLATVPPDVQVVALAFNAGLAGYAAGLEVHVADRFGLADPIASRLRLAERSRPGHEKQLPPAWAIARFSDATPDTSVTAAREALACGELRAILTAVSEPLSLDRFLSNVKLAWTTRGFRVQSDPAAARAEVCEQQ